ncbi:MAG: hypothetical protein ABIS50_18985 [Luteolibacter sp.]|uniref:hypothetical protein n=1 Tax=Luteolibacter sp. TaxID=1962973 RepID=UPI0032657090
MSLTSKPATPRIFKNAFKGGIFTLPSLQRLVRLTFITGPRALLTSRLSPRSASYIMLLCLPAIMLYLAMTVPSMLFQSPDQEAYFYFASSLNHDLSSGYMLALSVLCMFVALTLPAASPDPYTAGRS